MNSGKPRLEKVGTQSTWQRDLYVMALDAIVTWPESLVLPSKNFGLLLAADARDIPTEELTWLARRVLNQGLSYLLAWGPESRRVHDAFDEARVERGETDEAFTVTVWEDEEPLDEAVWEFLYASSVAEGYEETSSSWIAVSVASKDWAEQLRESLRRLSGAPG